MYRYLLISSCVAAMASACVETARPHDPDLSLFRPDRDLRPDVSTDVALGAVLDRTTLVTAVLARNPNLDAARATWRSAVLAYRSTTSLADPIVKYELAPFSIGSEATFGHQIEISQKLPWPGKRQLMGDVSVAEAEAAQADYATLRLDLAEATVDAFDDDYLAARALEVNAHHRALLERIEKGATGQYAVGHAAQQDPLEARTEIISLDRERLMLETARRTAVAKLNRLLRRHAAAELPPPPDRLELTARVPAPATPHPKILAAQARVRARTADIARTRTDFYPDVELMGSYNSMWDMWQHRWMIGVGIEIPLQRDKRRADVERAEADTAKVTAELASISDMLDEDRDRTGQEVDEATQALALYETQLLPTAHERLDAALAGFASNQNPFSTVVMAEHALRGIELQIEQTRTDLDRRLAALDRANGRIPGGGQ